MMLIYYAIYMHDLLDKRIAMISVNLAVLFFLVLLVALVNLVVGSCSRSLIHNLCLLGWVLHCLLNSR